MTGIYDILGWIGTGLIVLAYFLVSGKKIAPRSYAYQFLNLLGAAGLLANVFRQRAWPAVGLQLIWAAIAVAALLRIKSEKRGA